MKQTLHPLYFKVFRNSQLREDISFSAKIRKAPDTDSSGDLIDIDCRGVIKCVCSFVFRKHVRFAALNPVPDGASVLMAAGKLYIIYRLKVYTEYID